MLGVRLSMNLLGQIERKHIVMAWDYDSRPDFAPQRCRVLRGQIPSNLSLWAQAGNWQRGHLNPIPRQTLCECRMPNRPAVLDGPVVEADDITEESRSAESV